MEIYDLTETFPADEKYNLRSQLRNSGNSVISNIAEAHGRYYFADKVRVLYNSRGEVEETRSHLRVARGRKYIDSTTFQRIDESYETLIKEINSYIKSLRK
jgi:four helix bundle protein